MKLRRDRRSFYNVSSSDEEEKDCYELSIAIIGPRKCGKTSLIERLRNNKFSLVYKPTNTIEIHENVAFGEWTFTLIDIPPHALDYHSLTIEPDCIILMFDSGTNGSYDDMVTEYKRAMKYLNSTPNVWFAFIGKTDFISYRSYKIDNMSKEGILNLFYNIIKSI